jgi:hypothetical protein
MCPLPSLAAGILRAESNHFDRSAVGLHLGYRDLNGCPPHIIMYLLLKWCDIGRAIPIAAPGFWLRRAAYDQHNRHSLTVSWDTAELSVANSSSTQRWNDVPRGTMDEVSSFGRLDLSFA